MAKFNCICYGESGVGKTPFCGTLEADPRTSPCLFLDVDSGAMSLDSLEKRPTVLTVTRWPVLGIVYNYIAKKEWQLLADFVTKEMGQEIPPHQYKSVVIDSGTEAEYKLRMTVVENNDAGDKEHEVPSQPDYLRTQERFRKMYRAFRDLPISLVITAGTRELKEESTGIVKRSPDFAPTLAHDLVRMTDEVFFMSSTVEGLGADAKAVKHLTTSLSQRYIARDRSGKLPGNVQGEKFYFGKILDKFWGPSG